MKASFSLETLSHHAYCLVGGDAVCGELVALLDSKHGIAVEGNADFFMKRYETFSIGDARELKLAHEMRPVANNGKKVFVIRFDSMTNDAQNALLKLLEEPAEYAHFFLIVPSAHLLLPTVKSRLSFIEVNSGTGRGVSASDLGSSDIGGSELAAEAQKFIEAKPAKRLEIIKKLLDDIVKEKKTKQDAINFLEAIQAYVYRGSGKTETRAQGRGTDRASKIRDLMVTQQALKYLDDRSPSLKMLLEYVAVSI